jgi:RNA polymerase sigma-70 factor, ECF subfamily
VKSTTDPPASEAIDSSAVAERYRASIYRYILRLVGDPARADDLTQETFLRVHQRIGGLRDPAAVEAWLYRIATNLCYDGFRQREHRIPPLPLVSLRGGGGAVLSAEAALQPDHMLEQSDMSECVLAFLSDLPDPLREVLLLHDLQGFTGPEIADRLGLSIHNVKIRLHRARTLLRAALSEGCDFSRDDRGVFVCQPKRPTPD